MNRCELHPSQDTERSVFQLSLSYLSSLMFEADYIYEKIKDLADSNKLLGRISHMGQTSNKILTVN